MSQPPGLRTEIGRTLRLAGPVVGGQIASVGLNFIDTIMVGKVGATALAAVGVGGSVWASLGLFVTGVMMALPPIIAQLDGAGERRAIAPTTRQALWVTLGLALFAILVNSSVRPLLDLLGVEPEIVPTTAAYLRALSWGVPGFAIYIALRFFSEGLGATRPTLYFGLLGLPANVLANYALMYGRLGFPELGAVGCGYATAVVWWAQCLGMVLYTVTRPAYQPLGLFRTLEGPNLGAIRDFLRVGIPIGIAVFTEISVFTLAALAIGTFGVTAAAGHQVAINFAALTYMVPLGVSMAVTVRVGNAVGRQDPAGARRAAYVGIGIALATQAVSATVILLFPRRITALYTDDPEVAAMAVGLLFFAAIFQLSDGLQVGSIGALRGFKDTRVPMLITALAYWAVGLPVGYYLGFAAGLGPRGVWMAMIAALSVAAVLLLQRVHRVSSRPG